MPDFADTFRTVRVKLESEVELPGLILVTSSGEYEGRATVAGGIAKAFAEAGYITALLARQEDAAGYSSFTGLSRIAPFATGTSGLGAYRTSVPNLSAVTLADRQGDGTLSATGAGELSRDLRGVFQITIADLGSVSDSALALQLARVSSGFVLAVRLGRAPSEADRATIDALKIVNARALGIVTTESDKIRQADGSSDASQYARSSRTVETAVKTS